MLLGPGAEALGDWATRPGDPPSVLWELNRWERVWGGPPSGQVWRAAQYLRTHLLWAWRTNADWPQFLNDVRRLHGRLEQATGRRRAPTRANASCFECGGVLLRLVDEHGLEEPHVTCNTCKTRYDEVRYRLALRDAAEDASRVLYEGELWETPARLSTRLSRSPHTLAAWRRDQKVRSRSWSGQVFLSVVDVEREHTARKQRAVG